MVHYKIYIVSLSPSLPQGVIQPFTRVTAHWRKGNNQIFREKLDTGSELTLIPRVSKHYYGPLVRVGAYGDHMVNRILAQIHFTVGTKSPQSHSEVISLLLECVIGTDILSNWQNLHIGFLTYGMRAIMVEKTK